MTRRRKFHFTDSCSIFEAECRKAFRFLVERFGFAEPEVKRIGHESVVKFHKESRTVSIAYEPGRGPIVELFYPACETGEAPTPWAERDGVPYAIRIPRLQVSEHDLAKQLALNARQLEEMETEYLSGRALASADEIARTREQLEQRRRADRTARQEAAVSTARQAFNSGEYRQVVQLLAPFEQSLSPAQRKKLDYARRM